MNIGTNRWALKTEFGLMHPIGKWMLEAYAGAWWFEDNDDFYGGQLRKQDPLASMQVHVSYTFKPRLWVALNTTYYEGGETALNGERKADRQSNSRAGITFSMPVGKATRSSSTGARRDHAHRQQLYHLWRGPAVRLDGQAPPLRPFRNARWDPGSLRIRR